MPDTGEHFEIRHTKVCSEGHVLELVFALLRRELANRNIAMARLAGMIGSHRNRLARIFRQPAKARAAEVVALCEALEIDMVVAAFATIAIRDPLAYYDPVLKVSAAMLGPVVEKLNDRRPCEIELLTPAAIEFLTDWIVDTLILNQQQISSRRETMASPPRLL
jgi:hypothetical protein